MKINTELKAIENYCENQEKIISSLKDIIQEKDKELAKLWHENKTLKNLIIELGGKQ